MIILLSYHVSSLFTNVPLDETIKIVAGNVFRLISGTMKNTTLQISKADLFQLLREVIKDQLFWFDGKLYEQVDGLVMGSSLRPLMTNTFMCSLKEHLRRQDRMLSFYKRYVDNTDHGQCAFLEALDNCHSSVQFTMELESNNKLQFLDMQILKKGCRLKTKVYSKPTNTGLLSHYQSHVDSRMI